MVKRKLSVVLATRNEEENIGDCLESVKDIADEIIVVDESSTDKTGEIAKKYGAKVFKVKHAPIFHKTKQKALDKATSDWILQLDADERATRELSAEIVEVINSSNEDLLNRELRRPEPFDSAQGKLVEGSGDKKIKLFQKHQELIEERDGPIGNKTGEITAFFIPRLNFFLGKPLIHAGVYPDASIRLVKKGKARFPGKSVHEVMKVDGEVDWLFNDLEHHDSPTFSRYLQRANRYTDLTAKEFQNSKTPNNYIFLFYYSFIKPSATFLKLYVRHLGFLDGMRGFIWSLFSALHFPLAYFKYWQIKKA